MSIFLTSSSNGIKKITCFGPDEFLIPHQIEITNEAYTFRDLLKEGIDFYRRYPTENKEFFLKDTRLGKLLNPDVLVRDHFLSRKGVTPQVTMVEMDPGKVFLHLTPEHRALNTLILSLISDSVELSFSNTLEKSLPRRTFWP